MIISGTVGSSLSPVKQDGDLWVIKGLQDLHPDPSEEEFMAARVLGHGMMEFYKTYAAANDDFEVVSAESTFSIPLLHPDTGKLITFVDVREQSPNYGKELEVHARGKRDAICRRLSDGSYFVMDHKTAASVGEEYFTKLEKDEQASTYVWATNADAEFSGNVDTILYNVMRKCYPKPPTPLGSGKPSVDREKESTTAAMFEEYIRDENLVEWYNTNVRAQNYYNWLNEVGDENFITRREIYRNHYEIENTGRHIAMIAIEMLNNPYLYPHPTADFRCLRCQFRGPCIAVDDGSDYMDIIENGFELNRDR